MKEISQYLTTPVQILLLIAAAYIIRRLFFQKTQEDEIEQEPAEVLEPMKKRDFQLHELKEFDGRSNPRILIGVNSKVFDVTRGRSFYGPGELIMSFTLGLLIRGANQVKESVPNF